MDFSNVFDSIWNMAKSLIQAMGTVWNWLVTPLSINVPLLSDLPLIGGWFNMNLAFSPIELLGVGILLLLVLWVVKNLIPLG